MSSSFLPVTDAVFQAEMLRRVGRIDMRTDSSPSTAVVCFSSYMLPKTVTMLLVFGPVTLLCGTFLCI